MSILDEYNKLAPSAQSALDLFKNEWSSAMPQFTGLTTEPGSAGLFQDPRIAWAHDKLNFFGQQVLELGPLEAGHTYMARQYGARRVVAIEANTRAYMKCLIVKELFGLDRVEFRLGDFNEYLKVTDEKFDICIASGVLYHCVDPIATLDAVSRVTRNLFIWTHYYQQDVITKSANLKPFFRSPEDREVNGKTVQMCRKDYNAALDWQGFCGGTEEYAYWLSRDALLQHLVQLGFSKVEISFEQPDHPNGPCLALAASRG